jgi:hypothetical protein
MLAASIVRAASTFETSVNFQTTRRNIPEDNHLHTRYSENLKPHIIQLHCAYSNANTILVGKHEE